MAHDRRQAFGEVAELYDRARPSYPGALADDVLRYARASAGDRAVEVGAGTGKATRLFAQRGLEIVALEPSPEMARVARRSTSAYDRVSIQVIEFERWRPSGRFTLMFSAQAWHWIDPAMRYVRAREALVDGGALAVFWNRPRWEGNPLRDELAFAYERTAPQLGAGVGPGPMYPARQPRAAWWRDWGTELQTTVGFVDTQTRSYSWHQRYTTAEYLRLLQTHSDHIVLDQAQREALLAAVAGVVDCHGGMLELEYETSLAMARRGGALPDAG